MVTQRTYLTIIAISWLVLVNRVSCFKSNNNLKHFISTQQMEAEDYSSATNVTIYNNCTSGSENIFYVGQLSTSASLEFDQVEFGNGVDWITLHLTNIDSAGTDISLHLGTSTNQPFATIPIPFTGSDACGFTTLEFQLTSPLPSGEQQLILTFPSANINSLNLDWFFFNRTVKAFNATDKIQAEDYTSASDVYIYSNCTEADASYVETHVSSQSVLGYSNVDFGSGVQRLFCRMSNSYEPYPLNIDVHVDSWTNEPLASLFPGYTGSDTCNFTTTGLVLGAPLTGVHDLFFTSEYGTDLRMDWFLFNRTYESFEATEKMEAEDFSLATDFGIYQCEDTVYLGQSSSSTVLEYHGVDFGSEGVQMVTLQLMDNMNSDTVDKFTMRLDSATGPPIATIPVSYTGRDFCGYFTLTVYLEVYPVGVHDLFFTFTTPAFLDFDWFVFNRTAF